MLRRIIFIISFFIIADSIVSAQQPWTLQQCIDQALKHNIQIKQSSLNNDLNKIRVIQNTATFFPSINGNVSQNYNYGRNIDPITNTIITEKTESNNYSLSGTLILFEGFQLQNSLKESKLLYISSQYDLKKIQNDISLNVVNYFLQVLFHEDLLKINREQMNASGIQRDRMKRMFELGSVNKGNYLEFESQYSNDELKYIQAQAQYEQSLLSLTQLLELDTIKIFTILKPEIMTPLFDSTENQVDPIFAMALKNQPDIKSSEYKILSAKKNLKSTKGTLYPRLFLSGSLNTYYSKKIIDPFLFTEVPFKNQFENNLGKSFGLTMQVPLFNGLSARTNVSRSRINLEQTNLTSELTKKNLYKSVQQAVLDAKTSYKKLIANQRSVDALSETFNYNQQRMDLGMINTYDYLFTKNNLANAQTNLLQAKYDYLFKIKILDFYQGKPLTF